MGKYNLGDIRVSYHATAYAVNGKAINHGHFYADFDSIEAAREWAGRLFRDQHTRYGQSQVGSVQIHGREMTLGIEGWNETSDFSKSHYETVLTDQPIVLGAADLALRCYDTTVMDYFETVHPRRVDGTCHCGDPTRNVSL
jgi:hypothetical protein